MGGITKYASPEMVAVMAVAAGSDLLLMPDNPETAIAAIYDAVQEGKIKESRIQASLARIWQAKQQVFSLPGMDLELFSEPAKLLVNFIVRDSLQQSEISIIPDLQIVGRNLIVVDDLLNTNYLDLNSPAITIPREYNYERQLVDRHTLDCILLDSRPTLLQIFIRGNPFRGHAGLTNHSQEIYQQLLAKQQITGIIVYGSPYVWEWFKGLIGSSLPWVFSYGQMKQSQAIAINALFDQNAPTEQLPQHNFGF